MVGRVESSSWFKHTLTYWNASKSDPQILFVKFEDLKRDLSGQIKKIASFLGEALTEDEVETVAKLTSFEFMKQDSAANYEWSNERR